MEVMVLQVSMISMISNPIFHFLSKRVHDYSFPNNFIKGITALACRWKPGQNADYISYLQQIHFDFPCITPR